LLPGEPRELPVIRKPKPGLALALALIALGAAVPAYAFLAPESTWQPESLVIALLVLAFISYTAAVQLRDTLTLDASFVPALLAVVFLGPVAGTFVFAAPGVSAYIERRRLNAFVGDTASAAWASLAAAWTLEALTGGIPVSFANASAVGAVAVAGAVFIAVQYLVTTVVIGVVEKGMHLLTLIDLELMDVAPVSAALIAVGALSAFLYDEIGLVGLVPLAVVALGPRLLVQRLVSLRDPAELDLPTAIVLYARALAEALSLDADRRRIVADAATHLGGTKRLTRIDDFQSVMQTVLYCHERWDGKGGFPGVLSGEAIPLESRVIAVAERLAALTAKGTRGLSPDHAVSLLVARAGTDFDPRVVAAARRVVDEDIMISPRSPARGAGVPAGLRSRSADG
jgi:hypothetical protein